MTKFFISLIAFGMIFDLFAIDGIPDDEVPMEITNTQVLDETAKTKRISAIGIGVAPSYASSPALAYALAKRAATVDAYRILAEKVGGVRIEGKDTIKNMQVQRSEVRAYVQNMIKNANVVNTTFKDGMCEVELEIEVKYNDFL